MRPLMVVVGGPSGSGKSTSFPVAESGVEYFNVDDVAAALNGGSYQNIAPEIRREANRAATSPSIRRRQEWCAR